MSAISDMMKDDPTIKLGGPGEVTEPVKPAVVDPVVEPIKDKDKDPPAPVDNLKIFSTFFENEFKSEDEIKSHYNSLKEKATKADQLQAEFDAAKTEAQRMVDEAEDKFKAKYNLTDNRVRHLLIMKEYPDSDERVMEKVITEDFSKTFKDDPVEVLKWKYRFEDPDIYDDDESAVSAVYKKYGFNPDATKVNDDDETVYINREGGKEDGEILIPPDLIKPLQKEAKEAIKLFNGIREKFPLPDKTNMAAEKEKVSKETKDKQDRLTTQWEPTFKNFADKELAKFKVETEVEEDGKKVPKVRFEFDIPESFRKEAREVLKKAYLETLVKQGVEYSKEAEQTVTRQLKGKFDELIKAKYFDQMWEARETQIRTEMADERYQESHNPRPINTRMAPAKSESEKQKRNEAVDDGIGKRFGVGI